MVALLDRDASKDSGQSRRNFLRELANADAVADPNLPQGRARLVRKTSNIHRAFSRLAASLIN